MRIEIKGRVLATGVENGNFYVQVEANGGYQGPQTFAVSRANAQIAAGGLFKEVRIIVTDEPEETKSEATEQG